MRRLHVLWMLIILLFCACSSSEKKTLHVFSWSEFFDRSLITKFEEEFNCRVVLDTYDSNESMYAKLKLGAAGYDVIFPSAYYLELLEHQGLIHQLQDNRIPNIANLDPHYYQTNKPLFGVPFLVSFTGIAYRKDRIGRIEPTWGIFSQGNLKGRMTMLNDMRDVLGAALKYLGYSVNTRNPAEIEKAGDVLIEWKKNLAKFEGEQYKSGIATAEFLVVEAYSVDIMQVQQEDPNVVFVFPKEGAILAVDYMAVPKRAKNIDLAYSFINFLLDSEVAAQNMNFIRTLIPIVPAYQKLDPKLKKSPILFPKREILEKMEQIQDLGKDIKYYHEVWERVKGS